MLLRSHDFVDRWESRTKDAGPKTLSEIHKEADQQQQDIKRKDAMARQQQQSGGGRGRHDRDRNRAPPAVSCFGRGFGWGKGVARLCDDEVVT